MTDDRILPGSKKNNNEKQSLELATTKTVNYFLCFSSFRFAAMGKPHRRLLNRLWGNPNEGLGDNNKSMVEKNNKKN